MTADEDVDMASALLRDVEYPRLAAFEVLLRRAREQNMEETLELVLIGREEHMLSSMRRLEGIVRSHTHLQC